MNTVPELIKRVAHPLNGAAADYDPAKPARPRRRQSPYDQAVGLPDQKLPSSESHMEAFDYFDPTAHEVLLAGTFNDWQPHANPMTNQRGKWSTQLFLRPGKYEYRLVVDGQWQDDRMAAEFAPNSLGGLNCVREVKASARQMRARPMVKNDIVFWQGRARAYTA